MMIVVGQEVDVVVQEVDTVVLERCEAKMAPRKNQSSEQCFSTACQSGYYQSCWLEEYDKCIKYYPFTRKSLKWTKKLVFYLFQIAMYNSFVIYKDRIANRKYNSLYECILSIIRLYILLEDISDSNSGSYNECRPPLLLNAIPRAPGKDPHTRLVGK